MNMRTHHPLRPFPMAPSRPGDRRHERRALRAALALIATCGVLAPVHVPAQPVPEALPVAGNPTDAARTVRSTVVTPPDSSPRVGEPFEVRVDLEVPAGWRATGVVGGTGAHVELVDAREAGGDNLEGRQWQTRWVVYRPGTFVTDITVLLVTDEGAIVQARVDGFEVAIRSTIANESDPRPAPNDGPLAVLVPDQRPLWVGGAVGMLALGLLIGWAWRRRILAMAPPPPPPPPRPPHEVALERLAALEASGRLERGEHVAFHMELSEIVRAYVGDLWGFHARERTTAEIRYELTARSEQVGDRAAMILDLLADTDLVKFARFSPAPGFSRDCLAKAFALVDELRPEIPSAIDELPATSTEDDDVPPPPRATEDA